MAVRCRTFVDDGRKGAEEFEALGPALELVAEGLATGLVEGTGLAVLTERDTPLQARMRGLKVAIGSEHLPLDEAKRPEEIDKDGHSRLDGTGTDAAAEVAQIVLTGDSVVKAGEGTIALAFIVLAEVVTEAGIIGVAVDLGGDFKEAGTGRVIAVAAFVCIRGSEERAGEAQVNRGTEEPTEAAFHLSLGGQGDRLGYEVIVGPPSAWGFGERRVEALRVALVQFGSLMDECCQITRPNLL